MPPKRQRTLSTEELEIILIGETERRPVLWDSTSEIYKRADLKLVAFEEVASALNVPELTGKIVADRWKSIRSTFMENERVREFRNKCSGSGTDDVYIPKWFLYQHLLFLKKATVQAPSTSNLQQLSSSQSVPVNTQPDVYFHDNFRAYKNNPDDNVVVDGESPARAHQTEESELNACVSEESGCFSPRARAPSKSSTSSTSGLSSQPPQLFKKRGGKSKVVDKAVQLIKKLAAEPLEKPEEDSAFIFVCLVAQRLKEIESQSSIASRRQCK